MILYDGIDTKEAIRSSKFDGDPMTVFLYDMSLHGLTGDDETFWGDGSGMARYGRRLLHWDAYGFVWSEHFSSVAAAQDAFSRLEEPEYDESDDYVA